jgi:putative DNA primase/helicase
LVGQAGRGGGALTVASSSAPCLTEDIARLGALARKIGDVALIVIDPISAYLGRVDSHKDAEVRAVLAPLATMAAEVEAAVVCIAHMSKAGGTDALLRVMGSLGFVAAARGAYLVAKDPDDEGRRLFLPMKNNLAEGRGGLAFRVKGATLESGIETSHVEWDGKPVTTTADEAMITEEPEERDAREEAAAWLKELLKGGPVEAKRIPSDAKAAGISWRTVERAKARLGVKSHKRDFAVGWWWSLPEGSRAHARENTVGVGGLGESTPPKPSPGAGSTEDCQPREEAPASTRGLTC